MIYGYTRKKKKIFETGAALAERSNDNEEEQLRPVN